MSNLNSSSGSCSHCPVLYLRTLPRKVMFQNSCNCFSGIHGQLFNHSNLLLVKQAQLSLSLPVGHVLHTLTRLVVLHWTLSSFSMFLLNWGSANETESKCSLRNATESDDYLYLLAMLLQYSFSAAYRAHLKRTSKKISISQSAISACCRQKITSSAKAVQPLFKKINILASNPSIAAKT